MGVNVNKDLVELAHEGAAAGEKNIWLADDGTLTVEFVCRPAVGMAYLPGVPYAAALGVADALEAFGVAGAGIAWPHDVCRGGTAADGGAPAADAAPGPNDLLAKVTTTAGYGEGMFVVCRVQLPDVAEKDADHLAALVAEAAMAQVEAWEASILAAGKAATPLGPVLNDLFDRMPLMGKPVDVVYPNGKVALKGTLAGMDVWGRATVKNELGAEIDIAPEQARIRAAQQ